MDFPARDELVLTDVLDALADPLRLQIVKKLATGGALACGGASPCPTIPKSTLAHHFKVLRQAGVLSTHAEGTQSINAVRRADLDARFPGLLDAILAAE
jgi:predicted transcriptional regulator